MSRAAETAYTGAMTAASPWWAPHIHADRKPFLRARAAIARAVRAWFEAQDFVEVDTAALQVSGGNEPHLHRFATQLREGAGGSRALELHTSPEFACKTLLAAGEERIVSFGHVFRNGERGPLHHPEFTMLEWYRAGAPLAALEADCAALLAVAARAADATVLSWRGQTADPFGDPCRVRVADAFARWAGIDLLRTLRDPDHPDREALAAQVRALGLRVAEDDTWSDLFSKVLSERVERNLGLGRATILCDYPLPEAALARRHPADPRLAERFELYACGVELANAFGELTDPAEQRARFEAAAALARTRYGETASLDEEFLSALAHMPAASGVALGFDRLVMLATGATRIEQVIWTPVAEVA